jgi:hypothetical protein
METHVADYSNCQCVHRALPQLQLHIHQSYATALWLRALSAYAVVVPYCLSSIFGLGCLVA